MKYDVFISYRREGGYDTAKHLNDLLVRDGYKVSFDIDTLRSGDFDTQLYARIDQCKDFILIVDQHAFDRTLNPNFNPKHDWLRCELAYALKNKKNVIPIFLSGISKFPQGLPFDIVEITKKNGPEFNRYYFNDFYKTLKERFLHKKRGNKTSIVVFLLILASIFIGTILYNYLSSSTTTENEFYTSTNDDNNDDTYGLPPAPKFTEARIALEAPEYGLETGFEEAEEPFIGYVMSYTEEDEYGMREIIVRDAKDRVNSKFYLSSGSLCNADLSWLPYILIEGNKVKIQYYYAGNARYQFVISMENVKR